ncbi:MAG: PTS IIA-like nitrogen regulatory protein PtsN [Geminicoccaceae bacterium]|nr:PTS IIA-like nitrogen regulatory protein PtsN [Geminicoccaceae bacterium]MDW8340054.1 PTS IIA-like nitrogen regulatory protein PtsN [Geminicoccaceae bacterium]
MSDLSALLAPDRVLLGLRATSKRQVLQSLAQAAARVTGVDASAILDALVQRERLGTTGLGGGIAIPHARIAELAAPTAFFARLAKPVDFEAVDDQPVDIVFLLLVPEDTGADHLKVLARIARLLRDPDLLAELRRCEDRARVHALLCGRAEPGR